MGSYSRMKFPIIVYYEIVKIEVDHHSHGGKKDLTIILESTIRATVPFLGPDIELSQNLGVNAGESYHKEIERFTQWIEAQVRERLVKMKNPVPEGTWTLVLVPHDKEIGWVSVEDGPGPYLLSG